MKKILLTALSLLSVATAFTQNWSLNGNGNVGANNFLGTTNAQPLSLRTNNLERMLITSGGNFAIGTTTTTQRKFSIQDAGNRTTAYFLNTANSVNGFTNVSLWSEINNSGAGDKRAGYFYSRGANGSNFGLYARAENAAANYGVFASGNSAVGTTAYALYSQASGSGNNFAGYFTGGKVYVGDRLGITDETPDYALDFGATYGDKISLYTTANNAQNWHYGLGVQNGLLQIHTDGIQSDIAFGVGRSGQFTEKMRITGGGRVGINEPNPQATLHIKGSVAEYPLLVRTGDNVTRFKVNPNGSVSIGTTVEAPNPNSLVVGDQVLINTGTGADGYLLCVNGKAICEELMVQLNDAWPDYVFQPGYRLPPLSEVEQHIAEKGHLPGVPSAADVCEKGGIELGAMNQVLLEKIEQMTLYQISLEKRLAALEQLVSEKNNPSKK